MRTAALIAHYCLCHCGLSLASHYTPSAPSIASGRSGSHMLLCDCRSCCRWYWRRHWDPRGNRPYSHVCRWIVSRDMLPPFRPAPPLLKPSLSILPIIMPMPTRLHHLCHMLCLILWTPTRAPRPTAQAACCRASQLQRGFQRSGTDQQRGGSHSPVACALQPCFHAQVVCLLLVAYPLLLTSARPYHGSFTPPLVIGRVAPRLSLGRW